MNPPEDKANTLSSEPITQQTTVAIFAPPASSRQVCFAGSNVINQWQARKHAFFAVLLILLTTMVVVAYYYNHPRPEPLADTGSYLFAVDRILARGQIVDSWRLPGYPLFIALIYILPGLGNLAAVSYVQAVLFVLATLEIYILTVIILRCGWVAFLIALLVGINIPLLSFVKPIMSEAPSLWLLTSLALAAVVFLSSLRVSAFWLMTVCMLLLFFTRPEWMYLPLPLITYLLLIAAWRGAFRHLLPSALASLVLCYAMLGGYIFINATQNHFHGVTLIQNINELGKVLQYHMQDEAPPQDAYISRILDKYTARGTIDPYPILAREKVLLRNGASPVGEFSQSIIEHHPGEFLLKSVPVFFSSLTVFSNESSIAPTGPFAPPLSWLDSVFRTLYALNILFPACALIWLLLLCWHQTRSLLPVQMMGVIVLLTFYGLISTTLGAYREVDYMRIHTLFDPLLTLVTWGTLLLAVILIVYRVNERQHKT